MRRTLLTLMAAGMLMAACGSEVEPGPAARVDRADRVRSSEPADPAPADAAPDFTVSTFTGDRFSLGEHKGTPVVLNFWESW